MFNRTNCKVHEPVAKMKDEEEKRVRGRRVRARSTPRAGESRPREAGCRAMHRLRAIIRGILLHGFT